LMKSCFVKAFLLIWGADSSDLEEKG
jgi:hypothetical protein